MRTPKFNMQIFRERRQRLGALLPNSAVILAAHPEQIRNHDVHHWYRQDSNFFYLTGFEEPNSVLVYRPGQKPETVMFCRVRDVERETWDGFRYGPEGVVRNFGIDAAYPIADFEEMASDLLMDVDRVYYSLYLNPEFDKKLEATLLKTKGKRRRSGRGILPIEDSYPLIGEMRLRKSEYEVETMRRACQITSEAHIELMKVVRPDLNERALQGRFLQEIMTRGAAREGYPSIVAGGANATTLHYVFNDQPLKAGDLLLVDAGAEYDYYSGDITRTYPVSGKFSPAQGRLYARILELQKHLIKMAKPSVAFSSFQSTAIDGLIDIMLAERLLTGDRQQIKEQKSFLRYYPHGVSHFLGLDVHDAGTVEVNGQSRLLEPGMAFTVEPGIYIPFDDKAAPAELRGVGIRIEDNLVITGEGCEVLTSGAPKEINELEQIVGRG